MASMFSSGCRLGRLFLFLLYLNASTAFKLSRAQASDTPSVEQQPRDTPNAELMALIRPAPHDPSGTFTNALELLASIQTSPSCNRVAASMLLDSCHTIEGSEPDFQAALEDYRSIYAAQLAMCEIGSANSVKPHSCDQLTTVAKGNPKGVESIRKDRLSQCLRSLESKPQWWTSYSNNRQNAGVMCQAARIDIEKGKYHPTDQLIKFHKSMIKTSAEAGGALGRATNEAFTALTQLQHDFATAKGAFQDQLLRDIESSTDRAQSLLKRLISSTDAAVQGVISRIFSSTKEVETQMAGLAQNVHEASAKSNDLQKNVGKVFQQVAEGGAEIAAIQTKQWDQSHEMSKQLQGSLQDIQKRDIGALVDAIFDMRDQLYVSTEIVLSLHNRQNSLDERMIHLGRSFDGLESKAETFHAAQTRQAEMQTRFYDQIQIEMQTTQGLLDEVSSSAHKLKATVDSTTAVIDKLASLHGVTKWVPAVGVGMMLLCALYLISPKHAGYAIATIILYACVYSSSCSKLFNFSKPYTTEAHLNLGHHVHIPPQLVAIGPAVLCMSFLVALTFKLSSWIKSRSPLRPGVASDLPFMDKLFSERTHYPYPV